jgi:type VI protein secretion system component Hcp
MLALQRSAGNTSTLALLRRARARTDEAPMTLTLPGIVSDAVVSSWSFDRDSRSEITGVEITRPTDADSPVLAKAMIDGPRVEGRVVVRKLTPAGWVRQLTVTMDDCSVSSFQIDRDHDRLELTFSSVQVEQ